MKILIFVVVLVAVCGQSAVNVQADVIECEFRDQELDESDEDKVSYICEVKSIKQDENQNVITGNHKTGKSDSDVTAVYYLSEDNSINLTNFDSIFCQKFLNLKIIALNNVKPVNLIENALHGCPNLNLFQLDNADIKQMPDNFFSNNLKLTDLSLGHNQLEKLPQNIFSALEKLNKLILNENQLNYLPENVFQPLIKLEYLTIENNDLSTLSPGLFDNLGNLKVLSLKSNKIEDLPQNIFVNLHKLEDLKLEGNNLVTIHADSFGKMPQLVFVDLSYNKITSIDKKLFDDTDVTKFYMKGIRCTQEYIGYRMEMWLFECFNNYQPRSAEAQN